MTLWKKLQKLVEAINTYYAFALFVIGVILVGIGVTTLVIGLRDENAKPSVRS